MPGQCPSVKLRGRPGRHKVTPFHANRRRRQAAQGGIRVDHARRGGRVLRVLHARADSRRMGDTRTSSSHSGRRPGRTAGSPGGWLAGTPCSLVSSCPASRRSNAARDARDAQSAWWAARTAAGRSGAASGAPSVPTGLRSAGQRCPARTRCPCRSGSPPGRSSRPPSSWRRSSMPNVPPDAIDRARALFGDFIEGR